MPCELKSRRSKERDAGSLANNNTNEKILRALTKSAKKNRKSLVPILNKVYQPGSATQISQLISRCEKNNPKMLSPETALALISSCGLSQDDYQTIRNVAIAHNADIFPTYHKVLAVKKECYPSNIQTTETSATQSLQKLLEHTANRILKIDEVKKQILGDCETNRSYLERTKELSLKCKWGFDGSTGQSRYKQHFSDLSSDDRSLFSVMIVPLDLSDGKISFWRNPVPSSPRFCRPLKIKYAKETPELIQNECIEVENQIEKLNQLSLKLNYEKIDKSVEILIKFDLSLTMIDGKAVNSVSNNSSSRTCNICKAT